MPFRIELPRERFEQVADVTLIQQYRYTLSRSAR